MNGPFELGIIEDLEQILKSRTMQPDHKRKICCVGSMVRSGQYLGKNQLSGKIQTVFQFVCCGNPVSFFIYQNIHGIFQILAGKKK